MPAYKNTLTHNIKFIASIANDGSQHRECHKLTQIAILPLGIRLQTTATTTTTTTTLAQRGQSISMKTSFIGRDFPFAIRWNFAITVHSIENFILDFSHFILIPLLVYLLPSHIDLFHQFQSNRYLSRSKSMQTISTNHKTDIFVMVGGCVCVYAYGGKIKSTHAEINLCSHISL